MAHLGLAESHDMLQQLMNLTNMLILSKNTDMARQALSTCENLVLEHEGKQTLDNGICQMMYGTIALSEGSISVQGVTHLRTCNPMAEVEESETVRFVAPARHLNDAERK